MSARPVHHPESQRGRRAHPLTIAHYDREKGVVTIIFQTVGATTMELAELKEGEYIHDFVGPLGNPSETEEFKGKKVAVIGGGGLRHCLASGQGHP